MDPTAQEKQRVEQTLSSITESAFNAGNSKLQNLPLSADYNIHSFTSIVPGGSPGRVRFIHMPGSPKLEQSEFDIVKLAGAVLGGDVTSINPTGRYVIECRYPHSDQPPNATRFTMELDDAKRLLEMCLDNYKIPGKQLLKLTRMFMNRVKQRPALDISFDRNIAKALESKLNSRPDDEVNFLLQQAYMAISESERQDTLIGSIGTEKQPFLLKHGERRGLLVDAVPITVNIPPKHRLAMGKSNLMGRPLSQAASLGLEGVGDQLQRADSVVLQVNEPQAVDPNSMPDGSSFIPSCTLINNCPTSIVAVSTSEDLWGNLPPTIEYYVIPPSMCMDPAAIPGKVEIYIPSDESFGSRRAIRAELLRSNQHEYGLGLRITSHSQESYVVLDEGRKRPYEIANTKFSINLG